MPLTISHSLPFSEAPEERRVSLDAHIFPPGIPNWARSSSGKAGVSEAES